MPGEHRRFQEYLTPDGKRWRMCAGVCIINSQGHVLVGERIQNPGDWSCPQGGLDDNGESLLAAASRKAYEECGLRLGQHMVVAATQGSREAVRYDVGDWLESNGWAGRTMQWVLLRCLDPEGDRDAMAMVDLGGQDGEPEFSQMRWLPLPDLAPQVWWRKRPCYLALQAWVEPILAQFQRGLESVDFGGVWERDSSQGVGLVGALRARGHAPEEAAALAAKPYVQSWHRGPAPGEWVVATYGGEDTSAPPRRTVLYPLGAWEERYEGDSTLFGPGGGSVERWTVWLPAPGADMVPGDADGLLLSPSQLAHTTASTTKLGCEVSARFLRGGELVLRRRFMPSAGGSPVASEEVFVRRPA